VKRLSPAVASEACSMTASSSTAEDADAGSTIESQLRLELEGSVDVPTIDNLFELESRCQPGRSDADFWQALTVGAAYWICFDTWDDAALEVDKWQHALSALKKRRYLDWRGMTFESADAAICGEINHFIQDVFH